MGWWLYGVFLTNHFPTPHKRGWVAGVSGLLGLHHLASNGPVLLLLICLYLIRNLAMSHPVYVCTHRLLSDSDFATWLARILIGISNPTFSFGLGQRYTDW